MRYSPITERLSGLGADKWAIHMRGAEKRAAGEDIHMLSIGEPDFEPPEALIEKTIAALNAGRYRYSSGRGEDTVLNAVSDYYSRRSGRHVRTDQVMFMGGTQNALFTALMTVAQPGDQVIVPEPYYVSYDGLVAATGAGQVPVATLPEDGFHLRPENLEAAVTEKTVALILNSPSNPAGAVLNSDEIRAIGEICKQHDIWIISDEVYAEFVYDGAEFHSPFDDPDFADITVVTSSISKTHAVPGFRAGWIVASEEFCEKALLISETMLFGAQPFIEDAAAFALSTNFNETGLMQTAFEQRARIIVEALDPHPGIHCHIPEGGMFVFADIRETGMSGEDFAGRLLDEAGVCVMPGEAFGSSGAGHIRISLTVAEAGLRLAVEKMAGFLDHIAAGRL